MHSWCRVVIFVVSISMKIGSAHAICAPGQRSTIVNTPAACTEATIFSHGPYAGNRCDIYVVTWRQHCIVDNSCNVCICSCLPGNTGCLARAASPGTTTEVCTACVAGERGDGLTCTSCSGGTVSTNPISGSCVAVPNPIVAVPNTGGCAITRSLTCSGNCACTPVTASSLGGAIVIGDGGGSYGNNWNCVFVVTANYIVTLQFTSFQIEQGYDFVRIRRCPTASCASSTQLLYMSGGTDLTIVYSSDAANPFLQLTFTTDSSVVQDNWTANWDLGAPIATCGTPIVPSCLAAQCLSSNLCVNCPANFPCRHAPAQTQDKIYSESCRDQ